MVLSRFFKCIAKAGYW